MKLITLLQFTFLLLIINSNEIFAQQSQTTVDDTTFVNLKDYSEDFIYDMKYATDDNFLKTKVYDCAECYLRFKTVQALIAANHSFQKLGFKIKIFDSCDLYWNNYFCS